jgi:hypothetical protein
MRERMNTEEFVARVTAPLKETVPLSADFDAKLMRAVEAAARPWWQRRHSFSVSPIGGVALAASFAGLVFLLGLGAGTRRDVPAGTVATAGAVQAADTVHIVRFVFADPAARSVSIAGDFNGWSPGATQLVPAEVSGLWVVSIALTPGRHEYAFVVDGERWVADPFALTTRDEFGQESSVVRVGGDVTRGV